MKYHCLRLCCDISVYEPSVGYPHSQPPCFMRREPGNEAEMIAPPVFFVQDSFVSNLLRIIQTMKPKKKKKKKGLPS